MFILKYIYKVGPQSGPHNAARRQSLGQLYV